MSGGFVKIYGTILDSSIWASDLATRVVWVSLLTMADRYGVIAASIDGIARRANVSEAQAEGALRVLQEPDVKSKSRAHRGRRLRRIDGGWLILNYAKYRELRTGEQVQAAQRAKRYREKRDESVTRHASHAASRPKTVEAEAEAEAESTNTARATTTVPAVPHREVPKRRSGLPPYDQLFDEAWGLYPKRPGNSKVGAWRQWLARVGEGIDPFDMLEGVRRYAAYVERERIDPRYVKHAETFLGRDRHFQADHAAVAPPAPTPAEVFGKIFGVTPSRIEMLWAEEDQGLAIAAKRGVA